MVCLHPGHLAPPNNALGPLGCFKRCHCIGVLAAPPACFVCMMPLRLALQAVSSFTAKGQVVGGLARQTGHNGAFCAVAAIGCWHVACVGGAHRHLRCGLQPKTAGQAPYQAHPHFPAFSKKKAVFFWALQAITQKTPAGGAVAARMPKLGPLHAKLQKCITAQNTRFGPFGPKKGIFRQQRRGPGATWASHLLPTLIGAWGGNMVPRGAPETGLSLSPAKLCLYKATKFVSANQHSCSNACFQFLSH
jgi:hypothetical protein